MCWMGVKRIAVIGNGGGGKTTLSRGLAKKYNLPLTHVDSIQFLPGLKVRDPQETKKILDDIANSETWVIDGFGSMEVMQKRFALADQIIFVDFKLWRHYWWCTKRQIKSIWSPRTELPSGCNEATLSQTFKLFKTLWRVDRQIRPKLISFFARPEISTKVLHVVDLKSWNRVLADSAV
jgi:adenylate kinase family enzyme